jgi:membrane-bound ClpP family serine protease
VNPRLERAVVRLAGIAMFAFGVTVAIRTGAPKQAPSWALRSSLVYLLELVLATVGTLYVLLTVAIHTVLRGAVPTTISKEGFTWAQEVTKAADEKVANAQEQLKSFRAELTQRPEQLAPRRENPS